ncbi:MAG: SCO family protein [Bauldia sp.]|nr:SCO family protein [Bauldia sp.]
MTALRLIRYGAWALVALALVGLGAFAYTRFAAGPAAPTVTIGGPFTLTDQNGQPVTEAALLSHPSMVFFGYTNCPDICPITLLRAPEWLDAVKAEVPDLAFYFITVDPERDDVEVMRNYLANFDPRIVGLTGTPEQIDAVKEGYRVFSRTVPRADGGYDVDHTAPIYLMNREGGFEDVIRPEDEAASALVLSKLRELG